MNASGNGSPRSRGQPGSWRATCDGDEYSGFVFSFRRRSRHGLGRCWLAPVANDPKRTFQLPIHWPTPAGCGQINRLGAAKVGVDRMKRRDFVAGVGVALISFVLSCGVADAGCQIYHYDIKIGQTTSAYWTTDGSPCISTFRLRSTSKYKSLTITSRPSHGFAGRSGVDSIAYRPSPGFKGEDTFTIRVQGRGNDLPTDGTAFVQVRVRVGS